MNFTKLFLAHGKQIVNETIGRESIKGRTKDIFQEVIVAKVSWDMILVHISDPDKWVGFLAAETWTGHIAVILLFLSKPEVSSFEKVERFEKIKVKALDQDGKYFEFEADGLLSVCIQHEIDHLDGKVFVDYLSALKRNRIKSKLIKAQKKLINNE